MLIINLSYNDPEYNRLSPFLNYKINNWLQFFFLVQAAALKQQISKFYPQIQCTQARHHIFAVSGLS